MEQKSIEYLTDSLLNWSTIQIRTVPDIMYQVICRSNGTDNNIEYRFHWFFDCTETYIHNHRFAFDTYCLEGEYMEKLWEIIDDGTNKTTYQLERTSGNKLGSMTHRSGILRSVVSRHHFPGNILHVETNQYHSISSIIQSNEQLVTFVARQINLSAAETTYILSPTESIEAPTERARLATPEERQHMRRKLEQILQRHTCIE